MGRRYDQNGRYSRMCEKVEVDTQREEWMADGREKYWNGVREDVKESKVDRVDADCSSQTEMEEAFIQQWTVNGLK
jgi:hypothetical protein